jgi:hypothetical protein
VDDEELPAVSDVFLECRYESSPLLPVQYAGSIAGAFPVRNVSFSCRQLPDSPNMHDVQRVIRMQGGKPSATRPRRGGTAAKQIVPIVSGIFPTGFF